MVSMDIHYPVEVSGCNCTLVRACHAAIRVYSLENDLSAPKCMRVPTCAMLQIACAHLRMCTHTHSLAHTHKCSLHVTLHSPAKSNQAEG